MSKQEQDTEQGPSTSAAADGYVALSEVERLFHIIDDAAYELQAGDASKAWEYLEKAHDMAHSICNESADSETNQILSGRTTTKLSIHTGSHPDVVRIALDRLKGSDDRAHDIILALYRDLQIARNRADFLGDQFLAASSEDAA